MWPLRTDNVASATKEWNVLFYPLITHGHHHTGLVATTSDGLAGPWLFALFPSREPYFRFHNPRNPPLLSSLPSPAPPASAPPALFPPKCVEDSNFVSNPVQRPPSRGPLSSPARSRPCSPAALPAPSLLPFQKDQFTSPLSHPQQVASSPRPHFSQMPLPSYQQHLCCQVQVDTSAVSCSACLPLILLTKSPLPKDFLPAASRTRPLLIFQLAWRGGKYRFQLQLWHGHCVSLGKLLNTPSLLCVCVG